MEPASTLRNSVDAHAATISLPYRFDTSDVWHTILKGAFALNAVLIAGVGFALFARPLPVTIGLAVAEALVLAFTLICFRHQEGSIGTLTRDRIELEPNTVLGLSLPGPRGSYALDRFAAVRVEFRSGPIDPMVRGGPNEVVWLVGMESTPNIAVARTQSGTGREVGEALSALLELRLEETGRPRRIRI